MRPMITNGGAHPADKWADLSVDEIVALLVDANPDANTPEALAARQAKRDIRAALFPIFNDHHSRLQAHEQGNLSKHKTIAAAMDHAHALDPHPHIPSTLEKVNAVLAATPFSAYFARPDVQSHLYRVIGQHSADIMHIERRYHVDRLNAKVA